MLDFVLRADREEGGDVVGDGESMNLVRRGGVRGSGGGSQRKSGRESQQGNKRAARTRTLRPGMLEFL